MPKKIDLTNQRFGLLTVLYPGNGFLRNDGRKRTTWICQCDCGRQIEVLTDSLRSGHTKSCGCLQREKASNLMKQNRLKNEKDLSNKIFNYILPLTPTEKRKNNQIVWKCKCLYHNCNEIFELPEGEIAKRIACPKHKNLSKGEQKIKQILLKNNIKFIEQYAPSTCINPKTNRVLRFDFYLPDYNLLIEFDGIQHFKEQKYFTSSLKDQQDRDNIKNQWAKNNNIKLKRISYQYLNDITLDFLLSI